MTRRVTHPHRAGLQVPAVFLALLLPLGTACAPEAPEIPSYDARAFYDTEQVFGASFSLDETRVLMTSDRTGVMNVYAQPIAGGEPEALTASETDANMGMAFFPNDERVLFTADQGGNELNHLYVLAPGGAPEDITPGESLKAGFSGFSADGTASSSPRTNGTSRPSTSTSTGRRT